MNSRNKNTIILFQVMTMLTSLCFYLPLICLIRDEPALALLQKSVIACASAMSLYMYIRYEEADKKYLMLSAAVIATAFASVIKNDFPDGAVFNLFFVVLYTLGINRGLFGKEQIKTAFATFLVFDLIAVTGGYLIYYLDPETVLMIKGRFPNYDILDKSCLIYNLNSAGIIAGTAVMLFLFWVLDTEKKKTKIACAAGMLINICLLIDSGCRSAQSGVAVAVIIYVISKKLKLPVKNTAVLLLAVCILSIGPLFAMATISESRHPLQNDKYEKFIDDKSTARYSIWKAQILSQKDDMLLGFGSVRNGIIKRVEYVKPRIDEETEEYIVIFAADGRLGSHNGYLGIINTYGVLGLLGFISLVFYKLCNWDNELTEKSSPAFLMIFFIWINNFENLLIATNYFACYLMMLLLLYYQKEPDCRRGTG